MIYSISLNELVFSVYTFKQLYVIKNRRKKKEEERSKKTFPSREKTITDSIFLKCNNTVDLSNLYKKVCKEIKENREKKTNKFDHFSFCCNCF